MGDIRKLTLAPSPELKMRENLFYENGDRPTSSFPETIIFSRIKHCGGMRLTDALLRYCFFLCTYHPSISVGPFNKLACH